MIALGVNSSFAMKDILKQKYNIKVAMTLCAAQQQNLHSGTHKLGSQKSEFLEKKRNMTFYTSYEQYLIQTSYSFISTHPPTSMGTSISASNVCLSAQ